MAVFQGDKGISPDIPLYPIMVSIEFCHFVTMIEFSRVILMRRLWKELVMPEAWFSARMN